MCERGYERQASVVHFPLLYHNFWAWKCLTRGLILFCLFFVPLDSPKPSSRGTQRSNTSLTKVEPWVDDDSLELISIPGSGRGPRKLVQPFTPEKETKAFKPLQNGLHLTNSALEGGEKLNATDKEGLSLLHRAVRANDIKAVTFLLDNGADINIKGKDEFTPLHGAVRYVFFLLFLYFVSVHN